MIISGLHPMNEKKYNYILRWIQQLSVKRPELGNLSICPFAENSNFSIQEHKLHGIVPDPKFEVIIYIVDDNLEAQTLYDAVNDYNQNNPDYKFIADYGKTKTYIQGVETGNGKYNLIFVNKRKEIFDARKKLAKTNYYDYWEENYLEEVLEDDYGIIRD